MKIVWICGLPDNVRLNGCGHMISPLPTAAWSWVLGHLPPPKDVDLHILCPVLRLESDVVEFDYLGAHWHCVRQDSNEMLYFWRRILKKMRTIVRRIQPDVIHGWGGETGCGYLATLLSKKAFVSVQGLLLLYAILMPSQDGEDRGFVPKVRRFIHHIIERRSYARAAVRFCESNLAKEALAKYYSGLDSVVVPHPLRTDFLNALPDRAKLEHEPIQFLFVGSLVERKGAMDAVRAFCKADIPLSRLIMIGSGPMEAEIRSSARSAIDAGRISILNQCTPVEIVEQMGHSQFFLLPTYADTGPTALKEALSQGLYPICYDNSGPKELVGRYCGTLVRTGDGDALSSALQNASQEKGQCIRLGVHAAHRVQHDLCAESVWNQLLNEYRRGNNYEI